MAAAGDGRREWCVCGWGVGLRRGSGAAVATKFKPKMVSPGREFTRPGLSLRDKRTRKPNSVLCGHSSRRRVAASAHQRPTRRFRQLLEPPGRIGPMRSACLTLGARFPPYLVLLRVGFTLPPALLPARCALTAPFHPYHCAGQPFGLASRQRRYVFCGTSRPRALKPASRTLSGTLPCGVRTFLSRRAVLAYGLRQRPPGPPASY